ncbi:MAG: type III-B CRISPR module RAMP protein Cmr1 [Dethiobacter sp.]|nr:type III-B CRISPR module RAMP protein Cmr1 [Dethiobacter sp.]
MQLNFQGEVLTPMFLGSADSGGEPELRAPSVRGALRYWLRALAGGIRWADDINVRETNLEKVKQEERTLFGSTDRRSPVSVLVIPEEQKTFPQFKRERAGKDYL